MIVNENKQVVLACFRMFYELLLLKLINIFASTKTLNKKT